MESKNNKIGLFNGVLFRIIMIFFTGLALVGISVTTLAISNSRTELKSTIKNYMESQSDILGATLVSSFEHGLTIDTYDEMTSYLSQVAVNGTESSYAYLVSDDRIMRWHPKQEKIGDLVENSVINDVISNIQNGTSYEQRNVVEYTNNGKNKYASYYVGNYNAEGNKFVLVVTVDEDEIFSGVNKTIKEIVTALVVSLVLVSLLVFFYVRQAITRPITEITNSIMELAGLNLDIKEDEKISKRKDEIGHISNAVSLLVAHLKDTLSVLKSQSIQLADSNKEFNGKFEDITRNVIEVNTAVEEIAKGSTQQALETSSASEQVSQMGDVIENNANNVDSVENAVVVMTEISNDLNSTLKELEDISSRTDLSLKEVVAQTNETNISANKIQEATQAIAEIASRTNLLSLNAAIEAARAGEIGNGFAVVAGEIRQLAESSAASAKSIEEVVTELINNSSISVEKMNVVSEDVQLQREKLGITLDGFKKLNDEIETVATATKGVYDQTQMLNGQKNVLNGVVEQLAAISEENAAGTEETSANMQMLSSNIEECRNEAAKLSDLSDELDREINKLRY